jgi:hypothetical protein
LGHRRKKLPPATSLVLSAHIHTYTYTLPGSASGEKVIEAPAAPRVMNLQMIILGGANGKIIYGFAFQFGNVLIAFRQSSSQDYLLLAKVKHFADILSARRRWQAYRGKYYSF